MLPNLVRNPYFQKVPRSEEHAPLDSGNWRLSKRFLLRLLSPLFKKMYLELKAKKKRYIW